MLKLLPLLLTALLCWSADAWATTRYVDSTAGACTANYSIANRNCTGSDGNSYATNAAAVAATSAGDTILWRAGTYTSTIDLTGKTGVAGSPITISAYPAGCVIGTCEVVTLKPTGASVSAIADVNNLAYLTVNGFVMDGVNACSPSPPTCGAIKQTWFDTAHHWIITNNVIKNFWYNALYLQGDNHTVRNNVLHDQRSDCAAGNRMYGIYYHDGANGLIEGNEIYNNPGGGIHLYTGPLPGVVVRRNWIHDNNTTVNGCNSTGFSAILMNNASNARIYQNLITNNGPAGTSSDTDVIRFMTTGQTNVQIVNNTFYNNQAPQGYGIRIRNATSTIVANNHMIGTWLSALNDTGTGTLTFTNRTTGSLTDCTVSTSDFTHKAGSSCINAGTAVTGYPFNLYSGKTAPDVGAFETFKCNASAIVNGNLLYTTCALNVNTPVLPATGITGMVALKSAVARNTTASIRQAGSDSVVQSTFDGAVCAGGETWTTTYTPGNLTDSALIGNSLNQKALASTALSATNSCAGGASSNPTFTVVASSSFTHADESPISATDSGAWTLTNGGSGSMRVLSNAIHPTDGSADSIAKYTALSFDANQYSCADLTVSGTAGGGAGFGLTVRGSNTARSHYRFTVDHAGSNNAALTRFVSGTGTTLPSGLWTQTFADGDRFCLAIEGETVYLFDKNSLVIPIKTFVDTGGGVPQSGSPGVIHSSTTTSAGTSADNWTGGNFTTAAPPPPIAGTLSQVAYRFYRADLVGGAVVPLAALNTGVTLLPNVPFAITSQTDCTVAACDPFAERLRYSRNGGTYTPIPTACGVDNLCFYGTTGDSSIVSGTVTCCLSGALTPTNGTTQLTSDAVPVVTLAQDSSVVQRRVLRFGPNAVPTDTYDLREYNQDGSVFTYNVTARVTVDTPPVPTTPQAVHLVGATSNTIVTMVWSPVTTLPNFAGYHIYQSTTSGVYSPTPTHTNTPASSAATHTPITQWTTSLTTPGTYYFTVTAFDTGFNESVASNEISVVVTGFTPRTAR